MSTIFYAWQSDLPPAHNLDLIESALEHAARRIREDSSIDWNPTIDRDTKGIPGSPDVPGSIFAKIDAADVSVFDVSIALRAVQRPCPNPNVMLELGYALKAHPLDRLLLVFNEGYGAPRDLPFDLGHKRLVLYCAGPKKDLDAVKETLAGHLDMRLREAHLIPKSTSRSPEAERLQAVLHDKFREMLAATGSVFLWADRDRASGYVVLTQQSRGNLAPPRELRAVVRYDPPGALRQANSAFRDEIAALEQLAARRGMRLLPPID
jgi:hypothetical protein